MKDYKAIFDGIESTVFEVGSQNLSRERIRAELEPSKHLEGRRFADDEYYTLLVRIAFYSGFRAQTVTDKLPIIDRHFPNYKAVAEYDERKQRSILNDPRMIKNDLKIRACVENAKMFRGIIGRHGSFQAYVNALPPAHSDSEIIALRNEFRRFKFLGERTAFHFMTDIGLPVLKPDRVIERIFKRLALVRSDSQGDALYVALIQEGRKFAAATGHPIRYIDSVFVCYGQMQAKEVGLERGICLETNPSCLLCGVIEYCDYYARGKGLS
jgi:DNA-3-methyladenine glycosylase I